MVFCFFRPPIALSVRPGWHGVFLLLAINFLRGDLLLKEQPSGCESAFGNTEKELSASPIFPLFHRPFLLSFGRDKDDMSFSAFFSLMPSNKKEQENTLACRLPLALPPN